MNTFEKYHGIQMPLKLWAKCLVLLCCESAIFFCTIVFLQTFGSLELAKTIYAESLHLPECFHFH